MLPAMPEDPSSSSDVASPNPAPGSAGDAPGEAPERRGPPPNPLYHPLFLPVLLVAFTLWFGWDGWLTSDPEMLEHQRFNQICFVITLIACLRVVPRGIREFLEEREAAAKAQDDGSSV